MSRIRKGSTLTLDTAMKRLAGLESITPQPDFGGGLTLAAYRAALTDAQAKLESYNTSLANSDQAANWFAAAEGALRDLNDRILAGVAARWGRNSDQYEKAGGTRKSERKRAVRQPVTANLPAPTVPTPPPVAPNS
jgi:hypothetical protein